MRKLQIILLLVVMFLGWFFLYIAETEKRNSLEAFIQNEKYYKEKRILEALERPPQFFSVEALLSMGEKAKAQEMINVLLQEKSLKNTFALAYYQLEGELVVKNESSAIKTLNDLCHGYIEPCIRLGEYFNTTKDYDKALKYFSIAGESNDIRALAAMYVIYQRPKWKNLDSSKVQEYAHKIGAATEFSRKDFFQLTEHIKLSHKI